MSKLNLINLAKDELSKEDAQRVQGGVICLCPCTCFCLCNDPQMENSDGFNLQMSWKIEERFSLEFM